MAAMRLPELALRVCVIPLAVASLWEMATNREVDETYGEVRFSNLSGFTYLVGINAVTAAYAVASILLSSFKSFARYDWLILVLDQASAYLLVTSASAAAEVLQLARRGDRDVSWGEVCSYFGRFCGKNLRSKRNSRPPAAAGWSWRPALCASGRRQSACAKALARCRRCAVAVLRGPRLAGSACAAGLLAAAAVQRCPAPGLPLSGLRSAGRRLAVRRCCAAPRRAARVGSARRCARVVLNRGRGADRWPAGALGCAADCLCDSIQSQRAELVGWARPAQGSGRPACEVDPHLELATGSNRFDPEQKRSKRVVTPSTRGDPRVDPPSASPLVCSAPPPPPLPIVTNQIELVADQISIAVAQLLPSRSAARPSPSPSSSTFAPPPLLSSPSKPLCRSIP